MEAKVTRPKTQPKTMSIPEAGKLYFGLARTASYAAAQRGEIPTIRIGGRVLVVVAAIERMLDDVTKRAANRTP
jgi:hypothetical protein